MAKKNLHVQEVVTEVVDHETGEITESKTTSTAMFEKEPAYVKLYLEDIGNMNGLNPSEKKVCYAIIKTMGYNNLVPNMKFIKEKMARDLGMKYNTLDSSIKGLHKKGILIRQARGVYMVDPHLFGRGAWNDVKKLRMTVEYSQDGRKVFNAEVAKQLDLF